MIAIRVVVVTLLFSVVVKISNAVKTLTIEDMKPNEFDFDYMELPGNSHEFRMEVGAGRQECFFQFMKFNANLQLSFEVMAGGDRKIDFVLLDPYENIFWKHLWTDRGRQELRIEVPGVYGFCLDNRFSRFTSKHVYLFFTSFVPNEWKRFQEELQEFDLSVHNVTASFMNIHQSIAQIKAVQASGRQAALKDWYLIRDNNEYVQRLSLLLCVIIVSTFMLQTYFVRQLFNTPHKTRPSCNTTQTESTFRGMKVSA